MSNANLKEQRANEIDREQHTRKRKHAIIKKQLLSFCHAKIITNMKKPNDLIMCIYGPSPSSSSRTAGGFLCFFSFRFVVGVEQFFKMDK